MVVPGLGCSIENYRAARKSIRRIFVNKPPKPLSAQIDVLEMLLQGRTSLQFLLCEKTDQFGKCVFGKLWHGDTSDWPTLHSILTWEKDACSNGSADKFHAIVARLDSVSQASALLKEIAGVLKPTLSEIHAIFVQLQFNVGAAFGKSDLRYISLTAVKSQLEAWLANSESISNWTAYFQCLKKLASETSPELAASIDKGELKSVELQNAFRMAFYETILKEMFRLNPDFAQFNGCSYEQTLQRFQSLDLERIRLARQEVALAHFNSVPKSQANAGELGILRREMNKKRRQLPLRRLLKEAGKAVQAIKPVFMMSPISVAQYLQPGEITFDLLLMDEASQVRPVEALGAIARAKQIVVVGDERQLPPTSFFNKMLEEDDSDAENPDDFQTGNWDSILGLCTAQNVPQRMLSWHYRSRHHSLIAVSNHEFMMTSSSWFPVQKTTCQGLD